MVDPPRSRVMRGVLNFTPSWFSVNMGVGIMSILLHTSPHRFKGETVIGTALFLANVAIFLLFAAVTAARYAAFPWAFRRLLAHPSQSLFLGTVPMALATIVNGTALIAVPEYGQWARDLSWALWWVDVALTVASVAVVPLLMFRSHTLTLEGMTAAWLLPVVPAVVCAASGGIVAEALPLDRALITVLLSYVLLGLGLSLSFFIMALYFHRLAVHNLPNAEVIVSAFLPLGPCGQGTFALLQLGRTGKRVFDASTLAGAFGAGDIVLVASTIAALMLWGLGLWWLAHGVLSVAARAAAARLRFNMGFWGFIFPLGVFVAGTVSLGETIPSPFFKVLSVVLLVALAVLFLGVAGGTVVCALNGALLEAPCMSDINKAAAAAQAAGPDGLRLGRASSSSRVTV